MKTTWIVYLIFWLMIAVPLICFNLKKMRIKTPGEPRRFNWKIFITVSVVFVLSSIFLFASYRVTIDTRYEIAAEKYLRVQADYLLGNRPEQELEAELEALQTEEYPTEATPLFLYASAQQVRFQTGDQVTAKYAEKGYLPPPDKDERDETIYIFCLLEIDGQQDYYYLRMIRQSDDVWKVDAASAATEEQVSANQKSLANPQTGIWYSVEKENS